MTTMTSNKPYLIRAFYDWIVDNNLTPYILVDANYPGIQIPVQFVQEGKLVLNISPAACRGLLLENDRIVFSARFSGETTQIYLVSGAILEIYAKENGRGIIFPPEEDSPPPTSNTEAGEPAGKGKVVRKKPSLKLVE